MIPAYCEERLFDGAILGKPVWALSDPTKAAAAVAAAEDHGVGLLFRRGDADEDALLLAAGFRRIETLVTLGRDLPKSQSALPEGTRLATPADAETAGDIAAVAFRSDRWHRDPEIPNDRADAFKRTWTVNDVGGRADFTVLAVEGEEIVGFNAVLSRTDGLLIDLIAVAPGYQGRGIGRRLVDGALAVGGGQADRMLVGTQAENTASLALYAAMGFETLSQAVTWHWTPGR
ncbi:GNAT family N-acetyltransferase [Rhodospirillaceae bacterium KN72]|uniref:GNAT family N-acetyltransferase n=1 Tax=Pacificispira spongiicola TaxID=2729598 RepID=A0A7Y0E355_9PROT|nr:GNAT family N-acetyltransferase [Pacificispira spongiicola]NMM46333.1 GNAT family N-acetyltransferase [Pacificispira spongiicola]